MKKFPRLNRALDALNKEKMVVQKDMAEGNARRSKMTDAIETLRQRLDEIAEVPPTNEAGQFDPHKFALLREAETRINKEITLLTEQLAKFDKEVTAPVQERLQEASVQAKAVETLLDRKTENAAYEQRKQEGKDMDEIAQLRWHARNLPR